MQLYPTRGCPLACTFCVVPLYYGGHGFSHKSHRTRDPENVCDEIDYLADRYPGRFNGCFFNEETHNADVDVARAVRPHADPAPVERVGVRRDVRLLDVHRTAGEPLADAGYTQLRFGVESTSEIVGKTIHKTMHLEKIERFMGWCKAAGVDCYGTFQIGAPG